MPGRRRPFTVAHSNVLAFQRSENFNRGAVTCELLLWRPVLWEVISARE